MIKKRAGTSTDSNTPGLAGQLLGVGNVPEAPQAGDASSTSSGLSASGSGSVASASGAASATSGANKATGTGAPVSAFV